MPKGIVPNFLKPALRPLYVPVLRFWQRHVTKRAKSRDEIHAYWKAPYDGINEPTDYLQGEERSRFLLELVRRHLGSTGSVLEVGCNVGRNLNFLYQAGFAPLAGIEISENAVALLRKNYPELAAHVRIILSPVEEAIRTLNDREFDLVFTMAVLEHIHSESEWVFGEMVRVCGRYLITIEDENELSWRHFPRNYRHVFEPLGMRQVAEQPCAGIEGLPGSFVARVFCRD